MTSPVALSAEDEARMKRRAIFAAAIGTSIEWYDFFLYTTIAALVIPKLFFPHQDQFTAFLLSFSTYFGAFLVFNALTGDQFLVWGWRIPFLLSIVLVGVGLYIRVGILETPVFANLLDRQRIEPAPVVEVLRTNWREVVLSALARLGQNT